MLLAIILCCTTYKIQCSAAKVVAPVTAISTPAALQNNKQAKKDSWAKLAAMQNAFHDQAEQIWKARKTKRDAYKKEIMALQPANARYWIMNEEKLKQDIENKLIDEIKATYKTQYFTHFEKYPDDHVAREKAQEFYGNQLECDCCCFGKNINIFESVS